MKWVAAFCTILTLANAGLLVRFSSRLDRLEEQSTTLQANKVPAADIANARFAEGVGASGSHGKQPTVDSASTPQILIDRMREYKSRAASKPTSSLSAILDGEMAQEPRLPAVEQRQNQLLNAALSRMPEDSPAAKDVNTTCRGRRCLIWAYFDTDSDAKEWANDYLLAGGSGELKRARITTSPASGNGGEVTLQLYLD